MDLRGTWFAVCCAGDFTGETLDRFLHANPMLIIVDDADTYYDDISLPPTQPSSPGSPFKGQTPLACARLLRATVRRLESDIDYVWFVILDERTNDDDMVLLVASWHRADTVETVRAGMEMANYTLWKLSEGEASMSGLQLLADRRDGVLRLG